MKIPTQFSVKFLTNFSLLFLFSAFAFQSVTAQDCPTVTGEGIFNPNSDVVITSYHSSIAKTTTNIVAWGEDMDSDGSDATTISEVTPANGYNYTGTPIHFAVSGNVGAQGFLATTTSLYVWGNINEVVSNDFGTGDDFNDMNDTQTLPFSSANITQMHASSDVLFVLSAGQIWVATSGTTAPTGNDDNDDTIWQQVQTSSGVPLTGVNHVTGNKYAGYALLSNGDLYAWGDGVELGNGGGTQNLDFATQMTAPPVAVTYISSFMDNPDDSPTGGNGDTGLLALGSDTKIYGVGDNTEGELITGATGLVNTWTAVQASGGGDFVGAIQLATSQTSEEHAGAAVITAGATATDPNVLYTWGINSSSSIGQSGFTDDPTIPPSFTAGSDDPVSVSVGGHATTFFNRANGGSICFVGHVSNGSTGGLGSTAEGDIATSFECFAPPTVELCGAIILIVANDDSGTVTEGVGGIAVANVLANDDYDGSVPTTSDVDLTQISSSNPGISLNTLNGSVNVASSVPTGNYTLEYEICDVDNTTNCQIATVFITVLTDSDGDGISDQDDLDDDNDGILDSEECGGTTNTTSLTISPSGSNPISGSVSSTGGYPVTVNASGNSGSGSFPDVFPSSFNIKANLGVNDIFEYSEIVFTSNSIDDGFSFSVDGTQILYFDQYHWDPNQGGFSGGEFASGGKFDVNNSGGWTPWTNEGNPQLIIRDGSIEVMLDTNVNDGFGNPIRENALPYMNPSAPNAVTPFLVNESFSYNVLAANGANFEISNANHGGPSGMVGLSISARVYICAPLDTDNDGTPDHLDLDSDADGCSDALEAGATTNTALNYQFPNSPVGTDGIPDAVQTTSGVNSENVDYTITETNSGTYDFQDINVNVACVADLSLTKTVDNATPRIGDIITFTITLTNSGPADATSVQVLDLLPTGLLYDLGNSTIPAGTTYNVGTGVWDLSSITIANGATYILEIAATITPACGEITNTAQIISSNESDPDSTVNNNN